MITIFKGRNVALKTLLRLLFALLISSCAVTPPDVPLCTELAPNRGYCVNTISSVEYEVTDEKPLNGKTWWEMRPYMILMPIESWAEIKAFIIKICKKSKKCSGPNIANWERTVDAIDKKVKK